MRHKIIEKSTKTGISPNANTRKRKSRALIIQFFKNYNARGSSEEDSFLLSERGFSERVSSF